MKSDRREKEEVVKRKKKKKKVRVQAVEMKKDVRRVFCNPVTER
jgi:hypothetical protein